MNGSLKRWRLRRKLSQRQLAKRAGITQGYLPQLEQGQKVPSIAVLKKLARALEVPLTKLLQ
jgi:transcriptional regulator with XRE-family HTH domain